MVLLNNKTMKEEDKELLLKDLCARLPYGVVLDVDTTDWKAPQGHIQVKIEGVGLIFKDQSLIVNGSYYGDNYKPYLRPMSSMTEEEINEFHKLSFIHVDYGLEPLQCVLSVNEIDWLNAHHFDYRGLIKKGLALKASKDMYVTNQ
jgi:hypothetical protein